MEAPRNRDSGFIASLLLPVSMSLQLYIDIRRPKGLNHSFDRAQSFVITATLQRLGQRPFVTACQADKTSCIFLKLSGSGSALTFVVLPQLVFRD
jgi:hypothetical protein